MKILRRGIRREMSLQLLASAGLLIAGVWLCYYFFKSSIVLTIVGLLCVIFGIKWVTYSARRLRPGNSRLIVLLRYHPRQIVWVYSVVTERAPFGFRFSRTGTMYFKLIDGDELTVSLPARHLKLVSKLLNRLLPHASFGYSRDREAKFQESPKMLLRDKGKS